ncbi:MAG: hypothetical protein ACLFRP_09025, partial [Puniceicoccaceae bacterium]
NYKHHLAPEPVADDPGGDAGLLNIPMDVELALQGDAPARCGVSPMSAANRTPVTFLASISRRMASPSFFMWGRCLFS